MEDNIKAWMEVLLKRFGGDYATDQVDVVVVVGKEEEADELPAVQVEFLIKDDYTGSFVVTQFMPQINFAITQAIQTNAEIVCSLKVIHILIEQRKEFNIADMKTDMDKAAAARKKKFGGLAGRS